MSLDKVLSALGRTFIGAGVLVFLFVAYQLWGTGLTEARHQDQLQKEAEALFAQGPTTTETSLPAQTGGGDDGSGSGSGSGAGGDTTPTTQPPATPTGSAVAIMRIPKIDLTKAVVEGTGVPDLKKAPGHYTDTPLPGQAGNAAIAGHRTTYGAPFGNLDKLNNGDDIEVTTRQGTFHYTVSGKQVVDPSNVGVIANTKTNQLTLTTCHPKYSASKRLVITATLVGDPIAAGAKQAEPAPSTPATPGESTTTTAPQQSTTTVPATGNEATTGDEATLSDADLSGTATSKTPAFLWGFCTALTGFLIWLVGRLWKRVPAYLIGTPIFLVILFVFFENFSRLLPANA